MFLYIQNYFLQETQTEINEIRRFTTCSRAYSDLYQDYQEIYELQTELAEDIRIKKNGLTDAYNGIINKDLFTFKSVTNAMNMATNKMNRLSLHSYEIVDKDVRAFYNYHVSLIIEKDTRKFHTIVHIPIFSPESIMTYYKFHSHPITYGGKTVEFTPKNNLLAKNKHEQFKELSEMN